MEDVEAVGASVYLGEKATMAILDMQDPVLDLHAQAILIQLSQADDGVPQRGDVVDTDEQLVLAGLGGEDDGADALDLHGGGVPELDGASNVGVELGEELPLPGHVVGGAGVEVSPVDLVAARPVAEEDVGPRLVEVEERGADSVGEECGSMLPCTKNRAGSSPTCACATCA
jgi:hypothetical protein